MLLNDTDYKQENLLVNKSLENGEELRSLSKPSRFRKINNIEKGEDKYGTISY